MAKKRKISDAEWEIMQAIWESDTPITVRDLHSALYPNGEKAYTTVQTLMNILYEKGLLSRQKIGLVNFYQPTLSREQATSNETKSFVSRLFDGSFGALANHLISSDALSKEDLHKLKKLIEAKEKKSQKQ